MCEQQEIQSTAPGTSLLATYDLLLVWMETWIYSHTFMCTEILRTNVKGYIDSLLYGRVPEDVT